MSQHIGPRTISATGGSIKRVGPYRIHTFPSELVTDGLVLNLDAGDPRSYPGSGTTWTDLSGRGYTGTLVNATYSNANGGNIVFNGTNSKVTFPSTNIPINGVATISLWFKSTSGTVYQNMFDTPDNSSGVWITLNGGSVQPGLITAGWSTLSNYLTASYSANTWYNLVLVGDNNVGASLYLNGTLVASNTIKNVPSIIDLNTSRLGNVDGDRASEWFSGNISNFSVYNRALSAAEVAQNYDALKVRYTSYTNTFTPTCGGGSGKVEVLCVAGGGGGGASIAGGGGGGGLLYNSAFTVNSNTGIGLTVGAGGTGGTDQFIGNGTAANNTNGGNSSFSSLTSIGGGKGGPEYRGDGFSGGSGGGASRSTIAGGPIYVGGASTVGQGNSGGTGSNSGGEDGYGSGAGGGGAGSVGGNAIGSTAGNGGNGLVISISGASITYSGGGGGGAFNGTGGTGGGGSGGSGASNSVPQNALPNTGSGGGGGGYPNNRNAGNGSNGIVIVRYPATDYNVELLVVGGGGGGGGNTGDAWNGGGGGAGGLIYYSSYPVSAGTKYTITVGAGGIPGISTASNNGSTTTQGANGGNSILGPLVAIGGGGGGASSGYTNPGIKNQGLNGGSGGGSGVNYGGGVHPGGVGVSGQGNSGGQGDNTGTGYSGGGGGAGGPGTGPGVHNVTNFGPGLVFSITGSSVSYAQGGQGGREPVTNAAANSGTGGDGARSAVNTLGQSGAGGSGIIIIAYQGPQRGVGGTVDTTSRPGYTLHKFTTTGTDFFIP